MDVLGIQQKVDNINIKVEMDTVGVLKEVFGVGSLSASCAECDEDASLKNSIGDGDKAGVDAANIQGEEENEPKILNMSASEPTVAGDDAKTERS